jgi:hypothetical protein
VDPVDNDNSDGKTYLPTDAANNHIRTAPLNSPSTQDAQVYLSFFSVSLLLNT